MSNNAPDYENDLVFPPQEIKSQDDIKRQDTRSSDVLIKAVEKCEKLENENQQLKELLKECGNKIEEVMHILSKMPSIERNVTAHSILRKFMSDLDNAIGEK